MATITSDTYLDGGTARTAGEAWTMNGGVLTIRTDTRWHSDSPASFTGSLGAMTISATLGGGVLIDSTAVRWMPYSGGTGNAPAIGTTITQGGVSGYLLGVWADYNQPPIAVGGGIPATGYLKFREVTGGAFAVGALTGIGANASDPDRQGWIEVPVRQAVAITVPRLGFFRTRGGRFFLNDVTTGVSGQYVQLPTLGGINAEVPAIWIETGVGTDVYEKFPSLVVSEWSSSNFANDARGKFVHQASQSRVVINDSGVGFLPPAGCRMWIPSNIGTQCTSGGGDANNLAPSATLGTRPDFTTTSAGLIDMEYFQNDWYCLFASAYGVTMKHCSTFDTITTSNLASPIVIEDTVIGDFNGTSIAFSSTANSLGGTVTDCKFFRGKAASNGHAISLTTSTDLVFDNCDYGVVTYTRSTGMAMSLSQCIGTVINNCRQYNGYTQIATSFGTRINDLDHTDRLTGNTIATTPIYAVTVLTSSDDTIVDGVTFGLGGAISNVNPYNSPFYSINSSNTIFKNAGTNASPLSCMSGFAPTYACQDAGVNTNLKFQNIFLEATRTNVTLTANTSKNVTFESVRGTVGSVQNLALNAIYKGVRCTSNSVSGGASVYGSHWADYLVSDTVGRIVLAFNEPTAFSASQYQAVLLGVGAGFTSGGQLSMPNLNDEVIFTMDYFAKKHTALNNSAPTLTGTNTGNFSYEFQIDINDGNGWSGSWQTLNGANLSAYTISPSLGFKLKYRIVCTTANATNELTYIRILTDTTNVAQNNGYPTETVSASYVLTGLESGTEVILFNSANSELQRTVTSGTFTYNYTWISDDGDSVGNYALVWKDDKVAFIVPNITLGSASQSIPLTQTDDLVYNGTYTPSSTIDYANSLQILLTGSAYSIPQLYSEWKDSIRLTNNAQYDFAYEPLGGQPTGGIKAIPKYVFQANAWKLRPYEADSQIAMTDGIIVPESGSPFVNTLGGFNVNVEYDAPVQAIAVSTGAIVAPTQQQIRDAMTLATASIPATGSIDDKIDSVSVVAVGSALSVRATSFTLTTGTIGSGTYLNTHDLNGVYHQIDPVGNNIDCYYEFNIGTDYAPVSANVVGRMQGNSNTAEVWAYHWVDAAFRQIGVLAGKTTDTTTSYNLYIAHVGTGANEGLVRIKFSDTGATNNLYIDQLWVSYTTTSAFSSSDRTTLDSVNANAGLIPALL